MRTRLLGVALVVSACTGDDGLAALPTTTDSTGGTDDAAATDDTAEAGAADLP